MFTQGLARELGARGITVNNVQPGPIDTDLNPASGEWAVGQKAIVPMFGFSFLRFSADSAALILESNDVVSWFNEFRRHSFQIVNEQNRLATCISQQVC
jgi:NAD(P)-dependent dehydrogenase (short-subunit alcohol dehydrogenase family)